MDSESVPRRLPKEAIFHSVFCFRHRGMRLLIILPRYFLGSSKSLIEKLESPDFLPHFLGPEELEAVSLKKIEWYPDSLVWCLTMTRREMKKS